jgi:malonate transporter and related proteins
LIQNANGVGLAQQCAGISFLLQHIVLIARETKPMPPVLEGLIPVFLVIALGWSMRITGFIKPEHWDGFERVTYYILIPGLVITTLAMADLSKVPIMTVGMALVGPALLVGLPLIASQRLLENVMGISGPAFTSVFQGAVRWNSFVAVALAGAIYGKEGVALTAVAFAFLIPLVNLMSATVLARHGSSAKPLTALGIATGLIKNPFIWSTLIGIALSVTGLPIPKAIASFGDIVGRAALAAGLLLVGSGLDLHDLKRSGTGLWIANGLKLVAMPILAGLIGQKLGLSGINLAVPIVCASVPTAAASYILARQNGGDAPLMASIVTAQTILAAITMPLMLFVFAK